MGKKVTLWSNILEYFTIFLRKCLVHPVTQNPVSLFETQAKDISKYYKIMLYNILQYDRLLA
jgi:hypothetical protein